MKPIVRNILIGGAILGTVMFLIAKDKIETAIDVFSKINIKPNGIPKNVSFSDPNALDIPQKIHFTIDILLNNPAFQELSVSGFGVASLKSIDIYFKDIQLGTANLQLDEIVVPAQSQTIIKDIPFTGNTLSVLSNATAFANAKASDFKFTGIIEVLGIEYEIGS